MTVTIMKRSRRDFLEINRQIRKPMPPATKVILNVKDERKKERFDWRRQLEDEDEQGDDYKGVLGNEPDNKGVEE